MVRRAQDPRRLETRDRRPACLWRATARRHEDAAAQIDNQAEVESPLPPGEARVRAVCSAHRVYPRGRRVGTTHLNSKVGNAHPTNFSGAAAPLGYLPGLLRCAKPLLNGQLGLDP